MTCNIFNVSFGLVYDLVYIMLILVWLFENAKLLEFIFP